MYSSLNRLFFCLCVLSAIGLGCQTGSSSQESNQPATATPAAATTAPADSVSRCFRQTLNRDTTTLRLMLTGNRASGRIDIVPYEKDRAQGAFTGTRTGNTITADWQRSGEGVTETHVLTMTLSGDSISWGDGERVQQQGKWVLKQPGGTYRYALAKAACR